MEAVPRLPMLNIPMKTGVSCTTLTQAISKCIKEAYHDNPDLYQTELYEFETLRNSIIHLPSDFTGCSSLKRYYCQLSSLVARFPINDLEPPVALTWVSGFDKSSSSGNVNFEMNCVMFNIAALHMSLGALDPRVSAEGMKVSCTHFQCAAWAFQFLGELRLEEADLSSQLMVFLSNLALAQAQECILEKSMTDNRKPNIIAKVSMQVTEYFKVCLDAIENIKKANPHLMDRIGHKVHKLWTRYSEMKMLYYQAVTLFHQGLQTEELPKFGDRIAFYQAAVLKLEEVTKVAKSLDKIADVWKKLCHDSFSFANDVIQGKLTVAQKENEFVYHEKVPPITSLPEVKGASLVKGIAFSFTDPEVAGPDIFGRLVPMEAHQASSMYSEEKAKLLRRITAQLEEKNQELQTYLVSMQLDSFNMDDMVDALPQELIECCADLNSRDDALGELKEAMDKIDQLHRDVGLKLLAAQQVLDHEEEEQSVFNKSRSLPSTPNQIFNEMRREMSKYKDAIETALKNNQTLRSAIQQHEENICTLSSPWSVVVAKLPSVADVEGEGDKATRQEVQRLLRKVNEMQAQRIDFEKQLRENLLKDDVTKELVTTQINTEDFFEQQLQKHSPIISLLEQNMWAQSNILQALSEANAAFASTRRAINQVRSKRSEIVCSLISSYEAFASISQKVDCAKDFFDKLDTQISKLASRVKSSSKVQQEDRHQHLKASIKSSMTHPSVHSGPKLKDYLASGHISSQRPNPVGSEMMLRRNDANQYPPPSSFYPTPSASPRAASPQVPSTSHNVPMTEGSRPTSSNFGPPLSNYSKSPSAQSDVPPGQPHPSYSTPTSSSMPSYAPTSQTQAYPRPMAPAVPYPPSVPQIPISSYQAAHSHSYKTPSSYASPANYQNPSPQPTSLAYPGAVAQQAGPNPALKGYSAVPYAPNSAYQKVGAPASAYHNPLVSTPQYPNPTSVPTGYHTTASQNPPVSYSGASDPYRPITDATRRQPTGTQQMVRSPYAVPASSTVCSQYPGTPYRHQVPPMAANRQQTPVPSSTGQQPYGKPTNHLPQAHYQAPVAHPRQPIPQVYQPYGHPQGAQWGSQPNAEREPVACQHPGSRPLSHPQTFTSVASEAVNHQSTPATSAATPHQSTKVTKPASISNVDLLSDIDLSQGSQWSPLVPQGEGPTGTQEKTLEVSNGHVTSTARSLDDNATENAAGSRAVTSDASIMAKLAEQTKECISVVDPLSDDRTLHLIATETEKLSKAVQSLQKKSLNGPTNLEVKWKELTETLEHKCASLCVSVGRCYPLKNRFPDVLPFDQTRVVLPSERDDYINASKVQLKGVEWSYPAIVTQAPLPNTMADFWTMVWQNEVELIACLNTEAEVKGQRYYPREVGQRESFGSFSICTKQISEGHSGAWSQRTLHLTNSNSKVTKAILHMQFTTWPPSAMPESPSQLLNFISEVDNLQKQQRNQLHPVVVQCVPGAGRSGVFIVLSCFMKQLHSRGTLADLWQLVVDLCQQRRSALQDRSHLLFLYASALYYCQDVLMKRGILTNKASFEDGPREKTHVRHPSADLLTSDLSRMKANLGLVESETSIIRTGSQSSLASNLSSKNTSAGRSDDWQEGGSNGTSGTASPVPSTTDSPRSTQIGGATLPPNLAASVDPDQLVLEKPDPQKGHKITKDSFVGPPKGFVTDPSDPFGALDPLWSINKE